MPLGDLLWDPPALVFPWVLGFRLIGFLGALRSALLCYELGTSLTQDQSISVVIIRLSFSYNIAVIQLLLGGDNTPITGLKVSTLGFARFACERPARCYTKLVGLTLSSTDNFGKLPFAPQRFRKDLLHRGAL